MKSLLKRSLSALVMTPLMVGVIVYGGWLFTCVLVLAAFRTQFEWGRLTVLFKCAYLWWLLGAIYVGLSFGACYVLRMDYGLMMTLAYFCMVWASDIGAYAVGKTVGGPKLGGSISPNKTWAGYGGALLFPALVGLIFFAHVPWLIVLGFGVFIGITGQSGDLIASWLKRRAGVKDSGNLIPGHGGLLDRIDALMLCAPVFLGFVMWAS